MPTTLETVDKYSWWAALNHGGLLIAPARLSEFFVEEIPALPRYLEDRLRRAVDLVRSGEDKSLTTILDTVLESILGFSKDFWQKGSSIDSAWSHQAVTGEILKPRRLWQEPNGGILPVFTTEAGIKRIGVGKGRRSVSRVIEWLRRANLKLALLTNGQQWRLIHAGVDYDAWCEWDIDLWFEEGQPSLQVTALRSLLSVQSVTAVKGGVSPLLGAVEASRQGQAELSDRLGERVRQAVELLIRETLNPSESLQINHQSLYIAANRVIMRCVVILFAEARQLLPRDNPIYNQSYSLQGLREELSRLAGGRTDALRHRYTAYPRLLALFRLVYHGCNHEALPIPHYGGGLFKPGEVESSDPILQALAAFEQPKGDRLPSDAVVYRILEFLTRSQVKVRQGKRSIWVEAPVDFSDLSSEYIGILYEGLLDFELRQAPTDDPMIFLNLGNQPVLPLQRLEAMDDKEISALVEKLKKQAKAEKSEEGEDAEIDDETEEEIDTELDLEEEIEVEEPEIELTDNLDLVAQLRDRAHQWAVRAVQTGGLVSKPRSKKPSALADYENQVNQAAKQLIARLILPGEWFLVRWGGTRKGSGTFYTRPQLAVPTVRRTLEPLVYQKVPLSKGDLGGLNPENLTENSLVSEEQDSLSKGDLGGLNPENLTENSLVSEEQDSLSKGDLGGLNPKNLTENFLVSKEQDSLSKGDLGGLNPKNLTENFLVSKEQVYLSKDDLERLNPENLTENPPQPPLEKGENNQPKSPKDILDLKICDPACGSGSFLVAALRFVTDALWQSLFTHGWLIEDTQAQVIRVGIPRESQPEWFVEVVKYFPLTVENAETICRAKLKRYVVERCLYGVDINPLAVELGRLALWVETMDKSLPFSFLDHKLKCGNALVGCWFDRFQDYPVMAWEREGGDKNHTRFVNHFYEQKGKQKGDKWTQAIKEIKTEKVKLELKSLLEALDPSKPFLNYPDFDLPQLPEAIHDEALAVFNQIHDQVTDPDQQEEEYLHKITESEAIKRLKFAFDSWCAVWFWEGDLLDFAPTPDKFFNPPKQTRDIIKKLAQKYQFFHWELEFPDVFRVQPSGFDGMIGNPPWEIQKPNSMEFFSNIDPLYRTYGKQEALQKQLDFFEENPQIETNWLAYCDRLKALSNWTKNVGFPFGDPLESSGNKFSLSRSGAETAFLHELWRNRRLKHKGYADPRHPFMFQGSADINTYKMFLELSLLLLHQGGRMGLIVPSGVYTDKGSTSLRTEFLEFNQWEWLFGFENRDGIFNIHRSFKFCPVIVVKGGQTEAIKATFMQRSLTTWENAEDYVLDYPRTQITKFSPNSKAILEIRSERDLEVLEKMYSNSVLLGDDSSQGWGIKYAREFDMTNDSKLFPPRPKWEAQGYIADEYGHWLKGNWKSVESVEIESILNRPEGLILSADGGQAIFIKDVEDVALPLYEGRMIGQFDFSQKGWVSGKGRTAVWRDIPFEKKVIEPQFLMSKSNFIDNENYNISKVAHMRVGAATNLRSSITTVLQEFPTGDTSTVFYCNKLKDSLALTSILNSFAFDKVMRLRLGGLHLDYHVFAQNPLPNQSKSLNAKLVNISLSLCIYSSTWSHLWSQLIRQNIINPKKSWYQLWAITPYDRLRLRCILDAIIAKLYGLEIADFAWILKECDYPTAQVTDKTFARTLDPKGFWRVDKEKDPELRHTVLSLVAFQELKKIGLDAFLNLNDGEGWMLPQTLRLADYGLGHDDRSKEPQPVAPRLGERYLPWQLAKTPEQSWAECDRHAENLRQLLGETPNPTIQNLSPQLPSDPNYQPPTDLFGNPLQVDLFGNVIDQDSKRR